MAQGRQAAMTKSKPLVTRADDRAWGATVFAGTRVPVDTLFEYLEAGDTLDEFLRQFPTVTRRQAVALLESERSNDDELREIRTRWFAEQGIEVVVDVYDGRVVTVWRKGGQSREIYCWSTTSRSTRPT